MSAAVTPPGLQPANNLSDVAVAATSRKNLGLLAAVVTCSWTLDGDYYFVADEAMTLDLLQTQGTGTLSYAKALNATPTTFNGTTLPVTLATGDVLRVTSASTSGYKALSLKRTG